jgi:hypothetical protein
MKDVRAKVTEMMPEIVGMARRKKQRNNASNWNLDGSVMNLVLCDIENQVLMTMKDYLTQLGYSVEVLVFDGLMVRKDLSKPIDEAVLTACSAYIADKIGWDCALVVKPMNEHLDIPEEPVVAITYTTMKEEFEKTNFKCTRESLFYDTSYDRILTKRKDDMKMSYEHMQCDGVSFIKEWMRDPNIREYAFVKCLPHHWFALRTPSTHGLVLQLRKLKLIRQTNPTKAILRFCFNTFER